MALSLWESQSQKCNGGVKVDLGRDLNKKDIPYLRGV